MTDECHRTILQVWLPSVLLDEIFLTSISQVYHGVENKARKSKSDANIQTDDLIKGIHQG